MSVKTYSDSALEDIVKKFLQTFKRGKNYPYLEQIDVLMATNKTSITVNFTDFMESEASQIFMEEPNRVLEAFSYSVEGTTRTRFPDYANTNAGKFAVRFTNFLTMKKIRDVGSSDIGKFVTIRGMLMQVSIPELIPVEGCYECASGHRVVIKADTGHTIQKPPSCPADDCKLRHLELVPEESKFIEYQILQMQELQDEMPAGTLPKSAEVLVTGDLIYSARMGDVVLASGLMRVELSKEISLGRKVQTYKMRMYGNNVIEERDDEKKVGKITSADIESIRSMVTRVPPEQATKFLVESFAQRVKGHELIKESLILAMIGADMITLPDGSKIRGDINVFLVGDPGVAKSELGRAIERIAPRAFFTSGRGSTGGGLTASTILDKSTGLYMIKPGVTVLADEGLSIIDEFDKMRVEDRSALHEVMEQQCYDDQTEVLTSRGWLHFKDLHAGDSVACLKDGELCFFAPMAHFAYHYSGEMYRFKSRQVDLLVTPNHKMYVNINRRANEWDGFGLIDADNLPKKRMRFCKTAKWTGHVKPSHVIPALRRTTNQHAHVEFPITVPMHEWCEFLGYFISEGSVSYMKGVPYKVVLTQSPAHGDVQNKMISCLQRIGFKSKMYGNNITVHSKQFATHMVALGKTADKHIPREILSLPQKYLRILFNALMDGDGHVTDAGVATYVTNSTRLRDDFQELCLKLGMAANDYVRFKKGMTKRVPEGRTCVISEDIHELAVIPPRSCYPNINHSGKYVHITKENYEGMTYCVEVSGNLLYVRRNGKPVWCGNSVSIAKGGRIARLNARTSVIAIANPQYGRYDTNKTLPENIPSIPPTLLSRFDLTFIMRDTPDVARDMEIMRHIEAMYSNGSDVMSDGMDSKLFRKYIILAKRCHPTITKAAWKEIKSYYAKMRATASEDVLPITARQFEGLARLTVAHAKMLLKNKADAGDARRAIEITDAMLKSSATDVNTGKVDMGVMRGVPSAEKGPRDLFMNLFRTLADINKEKGVKESDMINEMVNTEKWDRDSAKAFFEKMHVNSLIIENRSGRFSLV